jgi:transposase-like protein
MNQQEQMYTLVEQWRESGLAKSKFCEERNIAFHQFNYWLKKYNTKIGSGQSKPEVSFFSVAENPSKEKKQPSLKFTERKTMRIDLPGGIAITIY